MRVQDLDLPLRAGANNRRLEVVAHGLPLFHGAQLAIDTTMVSPVRRDGSRRQSTTGDGAAMVQSAHPEGQAHGQARLVVVACEVGGQWSGEALTFLHLLADAKVRDEPEDFREAIKSAWMRRWKTHCWRAQQQELLRCPFSEDAALVASTAWRPHRLRWSGTTGAMRSCPFLARLPSRTFSNISSPPQKKTKTCAIVSLQLGVSLGPGTPNPACTHDDVVRSTPAE